MDEGFHLESPSLLGLSRGSAGMNGNDDFSASTSSSIMMLLNASMDQQLREVVATMPRPTWESIDNITSFLAEDVDSYTIHVPLEMMGCEPKFKVRFHQNGNYTKQEFIFKPARWEAHLGLNELIAYHVDELLGFHRVPPVVPMQIPYAPKILPALKLAQQMQPKHQVFWRCKMRLSDEDIAEWIKVAPKGPDNQRDECNETLVVIGSMQLKVPSIMQRNEVVRFVDKHLQSGLVSRSATEALHSLLVPRAPSIFAQRELGTRAIFDYLVGNRDRFNNDHVMSLGHSENRILVYIDNNRVAIENASAFDLNEWTRDCRFYHAPIQKLMTFCQERLPFPGTNWPNWPSLGYSGISVRLWTRIKYHQINPFGKMILSWVEPPNPVLRYGDIPFFYHLPKRIRHIVQRLEDCLQQKGFHHVFVEE